MTLHRDPTANEPASSAPDAAERRGRTELLVTASFFGDVVQEAFVARGGAVQIGNSAAIAVPVPEGWPYLARVRWVGARRAVVVDHAGREHPLERGEALTLDAGPVQVELRLVARYALRRTEDVQWWGSLAWFAVVFAATLFSMQGTIVAQNMCPWFGLFCPQVVQAEGTGMGNVSAEYLARLLREDYAGEDDGSIEKEKRDTSEKPNDSFYMPAGADGPVTAMGGAEDVAPEPIRTPAPEDLPAPEEASRQDEPLLPLVLDNGQGTPIQLPEGAEASDATADVDAEGTEDDPSAEPPAEEHRGWGIQDWYDTTDVAHEKQEIEVMLHAAKSRLRIDPNDPAALSILSYYQYLAEDYAAAEKTYDKFISLYPDDSAGYNNKALIYKRLGQYTKEEGLYRVALALRPDDFTALNNLAVCLAHQGRFNEALRILERMDAMDPDDPYAHLHRAKVHAELGDEEAAYRHLDLALQGMSALDTLHHIEFRQDIRLDPSFEKLRQSRRFHAILTRYYGSDSPLQE